MSLTQVETDEAKFALRSEARSAGASAIAAAPVRRDGQNPLGTASHRFAGGPLEKMCVPSTLFPGILSRKPPETRGK